MVKRFTRGALAAERLQLNSEEGKNETQRHGTGAAPVRISHRQGVGGFMDYNSAFVCLMGMGTVFFGLICLIVLTTLMGRICGRGGKKNASAQTAAPTAAPAAPAVSAVPAAAPAVQAAPGVDQQELIAAVSAALAEELGTDITGIRILSIKKL